MAVRQSSAGQTTKRQAHNTDDLHDRWLLRHEDKLPNEETCSQIAEYVELPLMGMGDIVEIEVTGTYHKAIVDKQDEDLTKLHWGYHYGKTREEIRTCRLSKKFDLGRIILSRILGRPLKHEEFVCCLNSNRFDYRRINLAVANRSQINAHRKKGDQNTTGYKGVHLYKRTGRYQAHIKVKGREYHLGYFDDPYQAYIAYCRAAETLHGKFACLE